MERWTRFVLHHRFIVLGIWIVAFVVAGTAASRLADLLTNRFTLPGTDSQRAEQVLRDHFGQRSTGSFTFVVQSDGAPAASLLPEARTAAERATAELPTGKLISVTPLTDKVIAAQIVSELEPADAKGHTQAMRTAAGTIDGARTFLTGQAATEHDLDPVFASDLKRGELYLAIPIALIILIFTFGTLSFLLPFAFALVTIPTTLGIIWVFANFMELTTYLQNLVSLIGLGIAIDYSLLMVYRFREEIRNGAPRDEAIVTMMTTAGRAVVFSGTAVAIGLAMLLFMPLPFMRGFGIGGLIIPLVSVVAALTFLPVLISLVGTRLERVRLLPKADAGAPRRHRARLLGAPRPRDHAAPVAGRDRDNVVPHPAHAARADAPARARFERGDPEAARVGAGPRCARECGRRRCDRPDADRDRHRKGRRCEEPGVVAALARLKSGLEADPQVARVDFDARSPQSVDPTGRFLQVQVIGKSDYGKPESLDFVTRLRDAIVPAAGFPIPVRVLAGGGPPGGKDFLDLTYSWFPWLVVAVLLATYVLLVRAFRSLLLPLKAIILNLLSIGAAYGLLVVVFKWGAGERRRPHLLRPDRGLDPRDAVRDALRPLDGLRGVPRQPDARGVGCRRLERGRGRGRAREDRAARNRRRPDHVRGLHGLRRRLDRRACSSSASASRRRS